MASIKIKENNFDLMSIDILTAKCILQMLINKCPFLKQQKIQWSVPSSDLHLGALGFLFSVKFFNCIITLQTTFGGLLVLATDTLAVLAW